MGGVMTKRDAVILGLLLLAVGLMVLTMFSPLGVIAALVPTWLAGKLDT